MIKILNKLFCILKNIMLPLVLTVTIYIVTYMFQRLDKEMFGKDLLEFLSLLAPFLILIILSIVNYAANQKNVSNNFFYNITSFIVMLTISVFCYRALFDKSMILWHKYGYNINFNYFSDQIAAIKVMLYGLSIGNVLLMIEGYIKSDKEILIEETKKDNKNNQKNNPKDDYKNNQKSNQKMNKKK